MLKLFQHKLPVFIDGNLKLKFYRLPKLIKILLMNKCHFRIKPRKLTQQQYPAALDMICLLTDEVVQISNHILEERGFNAN